MLKEECIEDVLETKRKEINKLKRRTALQNNEVQSLKDKNQIKNNKFKSEKTSLQKQPPKVLYMKSFS